MHRTISNSTSFASDGRRRRGTSTIDVMVALTLLITLMSVATPLVVRHGRLWRSQRDYRLALDELSNQLERLTGLPAAELPAALKQLSPSDFVAQRLPGAKLVGRLEPADVGQRLTLELSWRETGRKKSPVSLAAWIVAPPRRSAAEPSGGLP
jgi:hypothetical protein